jgi:hypothetical protein
MRVRASAFLPGHNWQLTTLNCEPVESCQLQVDSCSVKIHQFGRVVVQHDLDRFLVDPEGQQRSNENRMPSMLSMCRTWPKSLPMMQRSGPIPLIVLMVSIGSATVDTGSVSPAVDDF